MFLDGGVRRGTDVFKALALGASGVFVSKHTLQPAPHTCSSQASGSTIQRACFLAIFDAVWLGLASVQIGRPVLFSLAVDGEAGVRKVLQMLRDELELAMALSGCTSLREITRGHVVTEGDSIRRARL